MKALKLYFQIAEEINCPLYGQGERLVLTDKTFSCPDGKEVCLILVRDMTQLLFTLLNKKSKGERSFSNLHSCSGCTGLIKFRQVEKFEENEVEKDSESIVSRIQSAMQAIHGFSVQSDFLASLPAGKFDEILRKFQVVDVPARSIIVRQGEHNPNLYVVVLGEFRVESSGAVISKIVEGEIFGEMSYLGSPNAVATVRAISDSVVLAVTASDFAGLLNDTNTVQSYMARLLADRLQQINAIRVRDFEAGMRGRLDEVAPAELFQVFHMHQKTGVLSMNLVKGEAKVLFREGGIVKARYNGAADVQAIYDILAENKGFYRFNATQLSPADMQAGEIGDFMAILMEGVRRVDDEEV